MILGALPGQTAIKKSTGGYSVNDNATRDKYYGYTAPKKTTTKKVSTPKKTTTVKKTTTAVKKVASAPKTTVKAAVTTTPKVSTPSLDSILNKYLNQSTSDVNKLYDQQKNSQLQQLKAQQDSAINKINAQKKVTEQDYYDQRNQADVVNAQNLQRLREIMAANGVSASGENLTLNAQANSDRMNSLNSINKQEQAQMNDYANQISDINDPSKAQAIVSDIEAQRSKALVDAKNTAQEKAWREYTYNNMSAAQKAQLDWAKQQYGEDAAWQMYQLQYNGELQKSLNQAQLDTYALGFNSSQGGGGTAQYKSDMAKAISMGVDPSWAPVMSQIVAKESSYNPNAKNPNSTAYGYGQFLSSTQKQYEAKTGLSYSDPASQLVMMAQYIKDRYGTPQNALAFWNKNHWY